MDYAKEYNLRIVFNPMYFSLPAFLVDKRVSLCFIGEDLMVSEDIDGLKVTHDGTSRFGFIKPGKKHFKEINYPKEKLVLDLVAERVDEATLVFRNFTQHFKEAPVPEMTQNEKIKNLKKCKIYINRFMFENKDFAMSVENNKLKIQRHTVEEI